jgi:hypothetical protein
MHIPNAAVFLLLLAADKLNTIQLFLNCYFSKHASERGLEGVREVGKEGEREGRVEYDVMVMQVLMRMIEIALGSRGVVRKKVDWLEIDCVEGEEGL